MILRRLVADNLDRFAAGVVAATSSSAAGSVPAQLTDCRSEDVQADGFPDRRGRRGRQLRVTSIQHLRARSVHTERNKIIYKSGARIHDTRCRPRLIRSIWQEGQTACA